MSEAFRAPGRPPQGRVGTVVNGKWQIDARIGAGGMATVYSATHRNGHRAALKMLHPALSRDESTRARFLREGYVANAVGHPGVVRVEDDGVTEDGTAFLVLDLLEGETIEARRMRFGGTLPVEEVLAIADQALDALAVAHEKGIVHRDIKPENVFLTTTGDVKLFDFGLARMKDVQGEATKTGVTIGTPAFMPPEQALGRRDEVDARSDVWGVGATLFTAITGKYVHDASSLHEQLVASATKRARSVRELAPNLSPSVAIVIDRALELAKGDRWESAREMQRALRAARAPRAEAEGFVAESLTMPAASPSSQRRGVPSSDVTLQLGVPASDPTIEEPAVVILDALPVSGGPMTPPPRTERLTGAGIPAAVIRAQGPQTPRTGDGPPRTPRTGEGPGQLSRGSSPPQLSRGSSPPQTPRTGNIPRPSGVGPLPSGTSAAASIPVAVSIMPTLASSTGEDPSGLVRVSSPPRASAPPMHSSSAPQALPPTASLAPLPPPASSVGPLSLKQRRSARFVVIVSLLLIVACAAAGAWVLFRGSLPR